MHAAPERTPEGWEVLQIRAVCKLINGRGFKPHEWQKSGLPIIRIQNLNGSEDFNFYGGQYNSKILVEHGQLLFAWSGSRGTSFGPHVWKGHRALLNYHTWKVEVNESRVGRDFLLHALRQLTSYIEDRAHGASALVHTQKWEMEKFPILVPSSTREQKAIAAALSDVDALLGALDRLIAKKRDLKQAAMQQLLTGQTRLPGFSGKWSDGNLASVIGALEAGVSVNSVEDDGAAGHGGMYILKTSAVVGGRFIPQESKRIAARDLDRARINPRKQTLLVSRMNTPDLVGECGYIDRDYPNLFVPDRLWMTRFKQESDTSGLWLSYVLSTPALKRQIGAAATGTSGSMKNLSKQAFLQIPIQFPPGAEQEAIASVLADMDAELTALEQRRDKTRLLKQGMMQELLTGRTRLV